MVNHNFSDIYFEPNYGKIHEKIENGCCVIFEHTSDNGKIYHMFIKKVIPTRIDNSVWYDIVTPYGYGGPLIVECKKGKKNNLIDEFKESFFNYCTENNIVSEFIRFHPLIGNAHDFKTVYHTSHVRNTVGTNLAEYDDPFKSEFSKSCRKSIRKVLKSGVSYKIIEKPYDLNGFKKLYYSTMNRNKASDYYYFNDEYFKQSINLLGKNLLLVKAIYEQKVIAMGHYFIYNKIVHIHLSGTLSQFLYLSPAYILKYAVTEWGKANGYTLIHHGGGRSNDPEDNLYLFKKKFGKNTQFKFFTGKKIWNEEVYNKLCNYFGVEGRTDFFPPYRLIL